MPWNVKANGASSEKLNKSQNQKKNVDNSDISDQNKYSFRCRECEGFSQYQSECPNFLKQNNNKVLSLSEFKVVNLKKFSKLLSATLPRTFICAKFKKKIAVVVVKKITVVEVKKKIYLNRLRSLTVCYFNNDLRM